MAEITDLQIAQLAAAKQFQQRTVASVIKKSIAILEDLRAGGVNYTPAQGYKANRFAQGIQPVEPFFEAVAASVNVRTAALVLNGTVILDSAVADPDLDAQAYTTIFLDIQ